MSHDRVREYFSRLEEFTSEIFITLGDDAKYKASGCRTVKFQRESGKALSICDVLYVPGLTKNLISVSQLEDRGYVVTFRKGKVYIHLEGSSVSLSKVIGVRSKKLYRLQFEPTHALVSTCTSSGQDLGELWHKRMAHLHHGALKVLRESVDGIPTFSSYQHRVCKGCALGKYTKTVFPTSDNRSKGILDLIHSDVCGPMSVV
jgi:hypothetical protein